MDDRHLSRHNFKQQTGQHGSDCSSKILIIIVDAGITTYTAGNVIKYQHCIAETSPRCLWPSLLVVWPVDRCSHVPLFVMFWVFFVVVFFLYIYNLLGLLRGGPGCLYWTEPHFSVFVDETIWSVFPGENAFLCPSRVPVHPSSRFG